MISCEIDYAAGEKLAADPLAGYNYGNLSYCRARPFIP